MLFKPAKNCQPSLKVWRCAQDKNLIIRCDLRTKKTTILNGGFLVKDCQSFKDALNYLESDFCN